MNVIVQALHIAATNYNFSKKRKTKINMVTLLVGLPSHDLSFLCKYFFLFLSIFIFWKHIRFSIFIDKINRAL